MNTKFVFSYLCILVKTGDKHWRRGEIDNPVSARQDTETGSGHSGQRKLSLHLSEVSQNILILPEAGGVTRLIRCDSVTRNTLHVGTLAGLVWDQRRSVDRWLWSHHDPHPGPAQPGPAAGPLPVRGGQAGPLQTRVPHPARVHRHHVWLGHHGAHVSSRHKGMKNMYLVLHSL